MGKRGVEDAKMCFSNFIKRLNLYCLKIKSNQSKRISQKIPQNPTFVYFSQWGCNNEEKVRNFFFHKINILEVGENMSISQIHKTKVKEIFK